MQGRTLHWGIVPLVPVYGTPGEVTGFQVLCRHPLHGRERNLACQKKRAFTAAGGREDCLRELRQWVLLGHRCRSYKEHQEAWRQVLEQKAAGTLPSSDALEREAFHSWRDWTSEPRVSDAQGSGQDKRARRE